MYSVADPRDMEKGTHTPPHTQKKGAEEVKTPSATFYYKLQTYMKVT